ncbi:MAG: hypothetical protein JXJ04_08330 [Spirochaetales bacterium]|nr:hypothetical protein [Spirochaetales bacterium]
MNGKYSIFVIFIILVVIGTGCHERGTRSLFSFELALKNRGYNGFYFKSGDGPEKMILKPFDINEILLYVDNEISAVVINFYTKELAEQNSEDMSQQFGAVFTFIQKAAGKDLNFEKMKENTIINNTAVLMYQPLTGKPQDEFVALFKEYTMPVEKEEESE